MTRRAWFAFAAASVIWGVPYLFIKIAVDHGVTAPVLAWGRVTLGALVLLGLAWRAGTLGSLRGRWRWLFAFAVAEIVIPFPMLAIGEERVPSSLAAIMVATVPLIGAVLAMRFDHSERPTPIRAVGLLVGFCGVIALVGLDAVAEGRGQHHDRRGHQSEGERHGDERQKQRAGDGKMLHNGRFGSRRPGPDRTHGPRC